MQERRLASRLIDFARRRRNYVVGYVMSILVLFCLVAMWKFAALWLSEDEFASFALARRSMSMLLPFLQCGLHLAITQYVSIEYFEHNKQREKNVFLAALAWCCLFGVVTFVATWMFGDIAFRALHIPREYTSWLGWIVLWTFSNALIALISSWWYAKRTFLAPNILRAAFFAIPLPILAMQGPSLIAKIALIGTVSTACAGVVAVGVVVTGKIGFHRKTFIRYMSKAFLFGIPRFLANGTFQALLWLPVAMVARVSGKVEGAYVAFGMSLIVMSGGVLAPLGGMFHSMFSVASARADYVTVKNRALLLMAGVSVLATAGVLCMELFLPLIIRLALSPEYLAAVPTLRLLLIAQIPYSVYVVLRHVLNAIEFKPMDLKNTLVVLGAFLLGIFIWPGTNGVLSVFVLALFLLAFLTSVDMWLVVSRWRRRAEASC